MLQCVVSILINVKLKSDRVFLKACARWPESLVSPESIASSCPHPLHLKAGEYRCLTIAACLKFTNFGIAPQYLSYAAMLSFDEVDLRDGSWIAVRANSKYVDRDVSFAKLMNQEATQCLDTYLMPFFSPLASL